MTDDLLKELLAQFDLALPQHRFGGPLRIPPERSAIGYRRTHACFSVLVFVDQPDMGVKEPLHLVAEPGVCFAVTAGRPPRVRMKSESDFPRTSSRLPVFTASVHTQASNRRGRLPKGELVIPGDRHDELVGAVDALVLVPVPGIRAGQAAQHHHSRHESEVGVRFAGRNKLVHLIGLGEVPLRRLVKVGAPGPDRGRPAKASPMGTNPSR